MRFAQCYPEGSKQDLTQPRWVQEALRSVVRAAAEPLVLPEQPSLREAFLGRSIALNSFSAAALASLDLPLREILCLPPQQRAQLPGLLPGVPGRCLRLFWTQAAWRPSGLAGACCSFCRKEHFKCGRLLYLMTSSPMTG